MYEIFKLSIYLATKLHFSNQYSFLKIKRIINATIKETCYEESIKLSSLNKMQNLLHILKEISWYSYDSIYWNFMSLHKFDLVVADIFILAPYLFTVSKPVQVSIVSSAQAKHS